MKGTVFQPRVLQLNLDNINRLTHSKYPDRKNWGLCRRGTQTHTFFGLSPLTKGMFNQNLILAQPLSVLNINRNKVGILFFMFLRKSPSSPAALHVAGKLLSTLWSSSSVKTSFDGKEPWAGGKRLQGHGSYFIRLSLNLMGT